MTTLLRWTKAQRNDREALQAFMCTRPPELLHFGARRKEYARPWERLVQAKFRAAKPPLTEPEFLELGWDAEGIGAAVMWEELDGPHQVEVHVAAVAMRYRNRGGGWADEMITHLFDRLTERALEHGVDVVQVLTKIDEKNRASQDMARRFGMRQVGVDDSSPHLQRWSVVLLVSGAESGDA